MIFRQLNRFYDCTAHGATSLKDRQVDDYVNIESDVLGKYVSRQLQFDSWDSEASDGVNLQTLMNSGFIKDSG